jgi:hypothetical protein
MYTELYQYLLQHKKLIVPGTGTIALEREPAVLDFPNKLIKPPVYTFSLQAVTSSPGRKFFEWLSGMLHINETDAIRQFNDFSFELKNNLNQQQEIEWKGLGKIYKTSSGIIALDAIRLSPGKALPANRVLREKAEHMVRVGEDERSSLQMEEILTQDTVKKSYWWIWASVIALLALMFIGWYFSEHGLDPSSSANGQKLMPATSTETYKLVQ